MIKRFDKSLLFQLTKEHSIDYYSHTYYKKIICAKDLLNENVTKDAWSKENLRYQLFKWYFYNYKDGSEESCKLFFKEKLKDISEINEQINKEIKKCKLSINYTTNSFIIILNKLENLKDSNQENIVHKIEFNQINKITKKMKSCSCL